MDFFKHYGIWIDQGDLKADAAKRYVDGVHQDLMWIYRTTIGQILLSSIHFHQKPVRIRPYTKGGCNSRGGGEWEHGALTGYVEYSPETYASDGPCYGTKAKTRGKNGLLGNEVLFHELVHVFRSMSRKFDKRTLTGMLIHFNNTEEFLAVMVTNIYISDRTNRRKSGLRSSHRSHTALGPKFAEPLGFFARGSEVFGLVKTLCEENPAFTARVASEVTDAPFNPIADYYLTPDKAEAMSKSASTPAGLMDVIIEMAQI